MDSTEEATQIGEMVLVTIKEEPTIKEEVHQDGDSLAGAEYEPSSMDHVPSDGHFLSNEGHRNSNTPDKKIFSCDMCCYRTEHKGALNRHKIIHSGLKPFACGICKYRSYQAQTLKAHMMKHSGLKPFVCCICNYRSYQAPALRLHMMKHSGQTPVDVDCLSQHAGITEDPLVDVCIPSDYLEGVEITEVDGNEEEVAIRPSESALYKNVLDGSTVAKEQKPTALDQRAGGLSASPSQTRPIRRPISSAKGEKPFACDVCNYRSEHPANLNRHMKIHKDKKLYGCGLCSYRARLVSDVKKHMRTHSDERPYGCGVCDYRAVYLTHLQEHMKRQHDMS